jgi:hypothetical protein
MDKENKEENPYSHLENTMTSILLLDFSPGSLCQIS